jgi:hypothetical protein
MPKFPASIHAVASGFYLNEATFLADLQPLTFKNKYVWGPFDIGPWRVTLKQIGIRIF